MCDLGQFFSRILTPPGTGGLQAQTEIEAGKLKAQQDAAKAASDTALKAQQDALARAEAAAVPVADSESARRASEDRMRRLLSAGAFGVKAGQQFLGDAPIGYRNLMGQ